MIRSLNLWWPVAVSMCLILLAGCRSDRVPSSDMDAASALLTNTLTALKEGVSVVELREREPPVYVADELWQSAYRLEEFSIEGPGEQYGTNVRFVVTLAGSTPGAARAERKVTYIVTTTPAQTIARADR